MKVFHVRHFNDLHSEINRITVKSEAGIPGAVRELIEIAGGELHHGDEIRIDEGWIDEEPWDTDGAPPEPLYGDGFGYTGEPD